MNPTARRPSARRSPRQSRFRLVVVNLVSASLLSLGLVQVSAAGLVGTGALLEREADAGRSATLEVLLTRDDVAARLAALGVEPEAIRARVASMSDSEIASVEQALEAQVAGGDALGIIGAVFLVLLILELVGVTDVFSKI